MLVVWTGVRPVDHPDHRSSGATPEGRPEHHRQRGRRVPTLQRRPRPHRTGRMARPMPAARRLGARREAADAVARRARRRTRPGRGSSSCPGLSVRAVAAVAATVVKSVDRLPGNRNQYVTVTFRGRPSPGWRRGSTSSPMRDTPPGTATRRSARGGVSMCRQADSRPPPAARGRECRADEHQRADRHGRPCRIALPLPRRGYRRRGAITAGPLRSHKNVTVTFLRRPDGRAGDEGGGPGRSPRPCETADGRTATSRPEAEDRVGADRARRMRGRSSAGSESARRGSHAARRGANNTRRTTRRATRCSGVHRRRESANRDIGREHQDHRRRSPGHGAHHYCR